VTEASRRFTGGLAAGLGESTTLLAGPPSAADAEAREAIGQANARGLIVTPGCVLPLAVPDAHLRAAVDAVRLPS
jgi:uroporphyrinogen decarboxylase